MDRTRRLAELEEILTDILSGIQETLQSGQRLDNAFQDALADMIDAATGEIDQLRGGGSGEGPQEPQEPIENVPSPSVQLMWILAGQKEDLFLEYLKTYPDPEFGHLLSNPPLLEQTIQFLHEMMPSGRPVISEEGIPHAEVNSSVVYGYEYNPGTKKLKVKFQGETSGSGPIYEYDNVPGNVYKSFENMSQPASSDGENRWGKWWVGKNPSLGASFYQLIRKGGYGYRKLS